MSVRGRVPGNALAACEPLEGRTLFAGGDPDAAFGSGGHAVLNFAGAPFEARSVALRGDGKAVIAGTKNGQLAVVRLNVDGSLDATFGGGGLFESTAAIRATDVAIQPGDDKIVVTAIAKRSRGGPDPDHFTTLRILADGQGLDPTFDGDGVVSHLYGDDSEALGGYCYANAVAVQRDGKIVVGGVANFDNITYFSNDFVVARYNPDGSPDRTFGTRPLDIPLTWNSAAMGGEDEILDLAIDYNGDPSTKPLYGSIVAVGSTDNDWRLGHVPHGSQMAVARFRPNGTLDGSLDGDGKLTMSFPGAQTAWAAGVLIQGGGKIVVTGAAGPNDGPRDQALARFESNGDLDPTFKGGGRLLTDLGGDDLPSGAAVGYLGGILAAGSTGVAAYTADGVRGDTRFGQDGLLTGISAAGGIATTGNTILPTRRLVFAGGNQVHRYVDAGDNPVAIGTFDPDGGSESGQEEAHFLVTRTQRLPTPLRVYLNISGTATAPFFLNGADYAPVGFSISPFEGGTFVDIPGGQTFVSVSIRPTDDTRAEGDETAIISVAPDPSYDVGVPSGVTLEIHDNDASTVYAAADAHVRDGDLALANFGSASLLETGLGADAGDGQTRETYIKFDISSLNAATSSVRLRLFGRLDAAGPAVPVTLFGVSASGWGEDALTFTNRPPAGTAALGTVDVMSAFETAYTFDVTDFVMRERAAGRDIATLLLRGAGPAAAHVLWSSRHSEYSDPRLIVTGGKLPDLLPHVTQVFVSSSSWTPAFRGRIEDAGLGDSIWGYAVSGGAQQLRGLPWGKLDTISIRFAAGVNVVSQHLVVHSARGGDYAVTGFSYDPFNAVATWTLGAPLGRGGGDQVLLDLDGDPGTGVNVVFLRPRYLDGDWVNGAGAYDSGNGTEGGDFRFQLNALRGDVDGDGKVSAFDLAALRAHLVRGASDPFSGAAQAYSPLYDLNGDGRLGAQDLAALRAALFTQLPTAAPTASAPLATRRAPADRRGFWIEDETPQG
jgi:uncharacterized delta-60 repeat protein